MNVSARFRAGFVGCLLSLPIASPTLADPHPGQSRRVAVVGSTRVANGGIFPTSGAKLDAFTFSTIAPDRVEASLLASFDTLFLNVGSPEMDCTTATLSARAKGDIVAFVRAGGKLIISDSECAVTSGECDRVVAAGVDYSWLPPGYEFGTNNPGAQGASGTLTIVEENVLSSSESASAHFIDAAELGSETDAVGDMNVMITRGPEWCLDMSGTNVNGCTGPVHAYASLGAGWIFYNGLDMDALEGGDVPAGLSKIWLQELQVPLRPTAEHLACSQRVVGIRIEHCPGCPDRVENVLGRQPLHTVTAILNDSLGQPVPDLPVAFRITAGPNASRMSAGNECEPAGCRSGPDGKVRWTYAGDGGLGEDHIVASYERRAGESQDSNELLKAWVQGAGEFRRGDANDDGKVNIADPIWTLNALLRGGPPVACEDAADANDDGRVDLSDAMHLIEYRFLHGAPPAIPFPQCGADATADDLECPEGAYRQCEENP